MGVEGPEASVLGVGIEGVAEGRWDMLSCIVLASLGLSELGAFARVMVDRLGGCVANASSRKPVIVLVARFRILSFVAWLRNLLL